MLDPNQTPEYYADAYVHKLLTQEEAAVVEDRAKADKTWHHAWEDARRRKSLLESVPPTEATTRPCTACPACKCRLSQAPGGIPSRRKRPSESVVSVGASSRPAPARPDILLLD